MTGLLSSIERLRIRLVRANFGKWEVSSACLSPSVDECFFVVKLVMRLSTGKSPREAALRVWGQAFPGKSSAIRQRYVS